MGLVALVAIGVTLFNYTRYVGSIESVRGNLSLEITSLQLVADTNPRVVIRFKLFNRSPQAVEIESYSFALDLNGERVGTSHSSFLGTDPDVDPELYRKATRIEQDLEPDQQLDLEFTLYVYSAEMEVVRREQGSAVKSWLADANFRVMVPYAPESESFGLSANFEE
jgi:hypothetical protein